MIQGRSHILQMASFIWWRMVAIFVQRRL